MNYFMHNGVANTHGNNGTKTLGQQREERKRERDLFLTAAAGHARNVADDQARYALEAIIEAMRLEA